MVGIKITSGESSKRDILVHDKRSRVESVLTQRQEQLLYLQKNKGYSASVFEGVDIYTESVFVLRALAHLGSRNRWQGVPEPVKKRLVGLMRFYHLRFQANLMYSAGLFERWNENHIGYFISGIAALHIGEYLKDCVLIDGIQVYTEAADRERAIEISEKVGYFATGDKIVTISRKTGKIVLDTGSTGYSSENPEKILERSVETKLIYQRSREMMLKVPCKEDLLKMYGYDPDGLPVDPENEQNFYRLWLGRLIADAECL